MKNFIKQKKIYNKLSKIGTLDALSSKQSEVKDLMDLNNFYSIREYLVRAEENKSLNQVFSEPDYFMPNISDELKLFDEEIALSVYTEASKFYDSENDLNSFVTFMATSNFPLMYNLFKAHCFISLEIYMNHSTNNNLAKSQEIFNTNTDYQFKMVSCESDYKLPSSIDNALREYMMELTGRDTILPHASHEL